MEELKTHYDYIILGTGIQESILASALARNNKTVLHIDGNQFYGGNECSFNFSEFLEWIMNVQKNDNKAKQSTTTNDINKFYDSYHDIDIKILSGYDIPDNEPEITNRFALQNNKIAEEFLKQTQTSVEKDKLALLKDLIKDNRQFYISLLPKMAYSRGPFIDLLIKADLGNYLEFRSMEKTYIYNNDVFENVPCTKEDVFNSKQIKVIEKRKLMKFLTFVMNYRLEKESYEEYKDKPYSEYIKTYKLNPELQQVILQAINDSEEGLEDATTEEGLASTYRYLKSLGKWGNSPLICPLYGGGSEISQAFCRSCAVYGGVYMLDQKINSLEFKNNQYHLDCELKFTGDHLISSIDYLQDQSNIEITDYHKAIIITDKPLKKNIDISIYIIPPNTINNNKNRIMLIQQGYQANCCPKSKYIIYICTKATDTSKEEIKNVIQQLFEDKNDISEKNKLDEMEGENNENIKKDEEANDNNNKNDDDDDDDDEEEEEEEEEEEASKPKAYISVIFKQSIRKQKSLETKLDKTTLTIIDDMLPGISMETPVENALSIFRQLHPEIEEIYSKPQEEEEEKEEKQEEGQKEQEEQITNENEAVEEQTQ
ncbi:rab protein geranylgeranyltransferase component A [Piromyces finnis]|uniref:Rab escort protein 1 n=1 Tax=Piromyces finnis TaxID=1754191 RepID=A0A1Y1VKH5_9FUNG|nr:rab protein geranylgeranyltransferase component A [Piromyces finnis]|eukprot:ORX58545.1 rab protein geranylgeranyltransferase component A [Piromyces finnis]